RIVVKNIAAGNDDIRAFDVDSETGVVQELVICDIHLVSVSEDANPIVSTRKIIAGDRDIRNVTSLKTSATSVKIKSRSRVIADRSTGDGSHVDPSRITHKPCTRGDRVAAHRDIGGGAILDYHPGLVDRNSIFARVKTSSAAIEHAGVTV